MMVKEIEVPTAGDLIIAQETLAEAGLNGLLRLIVQQGESRILPETTPNPEKVLKELAGCLGQEPAIEYDFHLKIGGLYEAR